jgi:hypothetical protein
VQSSQRRPRSRSRSPAGRSTSPIRETFASPPPPADRRHRQLPSGPVGHGREHASLSRDPKLTSRGPARIELPRPSRASPAMPGRSRRYSASHPLPSRAFGHDREHPSASSCDWPPSAERHEGRGQLHEAAVPLPEQAQGKRDRLPRGRKSSTLLSMCQRAESGMRSAGRKSRDCAAIERPSPRGDPFRPASLTVLGFGCGSSPQGQQPVGRVRGFGGLPAGSQRHA